MAGRRKAPPAGALYEARNYSAHRLAPFSSDECPNSAEDSDEDVITDYLAPPGDSTGANSTSWEGAMAHQPQGPLVPIISVTPHSPGSKHYPVLDDNIQQLHEIHEAIQQMRETSAQAFHQQMLRLNQYSRLSASCPSLNNEPNSEADGVTSVNSSPTQQVPGSQCSSAHTTPQAAPASAFRMNSKDLLITRNGDDPKRRRSWTALGDVNLNMEKRKSSDRRRSSISLSSMDSDQDDPFMDQSEGTTTNGSVFLGTKDGPKLMGPAGGVKNRRYSGTTSPVSCAVWTSGGASTHSLNEADLQSDFNKIVAKREAENLRLLPARLPLQKSVSTPSIIAVRDIANDIPGANIPVVVETTEPLHPTIQNFIDRHDGGVLRPSGTESETEEDLMPGDILMDIGNNKLFPYPLEVANPNFDPHEGKRRKRGSIFFRKKKDKPKKAVHQWVAVSYGSPHGCDWCSKVLTNKPALYCENCTVTVHQNSCKDQIMECNKPKTSKLGDFQSNLAKVAGGLGSHLPGAKLQGKRGSASQPAQTNNSSSQIINEEKEADHFHRHHHGHHDNYSDEAPLVQLEFLDESPITAHDLETDPFLGLHEEEPDSWTPTVGKEVTKKLKEKEIKRQEHIYEFILTEKHHCLTLRVMQKVFVDGLQKYFQLGNTLDRMFPRLMDLTEIHLGFLHRLRERQKTSTPCIESIADILLEQFSGNEAEKLKSAYGEFCSRHRDAVDLYKDCLQHDRRFGEFVRHCQMNPLLKKKGIPECVLFVTQRLTKYPLLIEPLIKTAKDNKPEQEKLAKALALVKEILVEVDAQVAEKEKEDRKLEIYNRIDAKSFTNFRGQKKFKKSDILSANRRLRFEGYATLMQGRNKMQVVLVIVLSDVLFFLHDNSNKYTFFTPDSKAGVVSLQKLLVREKAGQESRGIYLISSNPDEPEMFELKVIKPKEKQAWISAIRTAVQQCPEEDEVGHLSQEERVKLLEAKHSQIRQIVGVLRQKDVEQALILEEKMALQLKLLAAAGLGNLPEPPSYSHLVTEDADTNVMWREVLSAFHEVNQLASSLYASGTNLSRSVSSVGEHQSEAYVSPTLPKRAETFGGFDNANKEQLQAFLTKAFGKKQSTGSKEATDGPSPSGSDGNTLHGHKIPTERVPWRNVLLAAVPPGVLSTTGLGAENASCELPPLMTLGQEQQLAAVRLSHYVYTLLCIISQQMTTIDSLQANLSATKSTQEDRKPVYRHNQQLEELRNLQDKLSQEREAWNRVKESEERDLEERRTELQKLQERLSSEQTDIMQQRETLHRRLEMLTSQGILISPNMPMVIAASPDEQQQQQQQQGTSEPTSPATVTSTPSPPADARRKIDLKWKTQPQPATNGSKTGTIPANHTNLQKSTSGVSVKQQLPLKLAKLGGGSSSTSHTSLTGARAPDGGVQQMLPMKLSQLEARKERPAGGYQRLSSNSFGPASAASKENTPSTSPSVPTHVRTGSSPAMMQAAAGHSLPAAATYPRPTAEKPSPAARLASPPAPKAAPKATEEEVIFF